jgi:DNA-binding transcriptional MerR regulator
VRISQLADAAGVPVATIKFYLREQLLHDGRLTSPTQAQYDESHVQRLRLIRALTGPGGLSIAAVRDVLQHIDHPPSSQHDLLGAAHLALYRSAPDGVDLASVDVLLERWGWRIDEADRATRAALAEALQGVDAAGFELDEQLLDHYARAMSEVADAELAGVPTGSAEAAVRYVVLGTVLVEPLLLALRRLAQQDASHRRFGDKPTPALSESTHP